MAIKILLKKYSSLAVLLCLCACALTSLAAQEPFQGFYAGLSAGYAQGTSNATTTFTHPSDAYYLWPQSVAQINQAGTNTMNLTSLIGGVTAGYDAALSPHWLVGLELGFDFFNLNNTRQQTIPFSIGPSYAFTLNQTFYSGWVLSAGPRIGFHTQRFLVYAIGGWALAPFDNGFSYSDNVSGTSPSNAQGTASISGLQAGWSAGGGAEFLLTPRWALQAEGVWFYFPTSSTSSTVSLNPQHGGLGNPFTYATDLQFTAVRLGIRYYFK